MLAEMPAPLWDEWLGFMALEPGGELRMDLRFGLLLQLLHSAHLKGTAPTPVKWFPSLKRGWGKQAMREAEARQARAAILAGGAPAPPGEYFPGFDEAGSEV